MRNNMRQIEVKEKTDQSRLACLANHAQEDASSGSCAD